MESDNSDTADKGENSGRCLFCLQEPKYMSDPKLLPCGDIVCQPCIERRPKSFKFKCPACGKTNTITDIEKLPDYKFPQSPIAGIPVIKKSPSKPHCAVCLQCTELVGYCVDCAKIMCRKHRKIHDAFFELDKHKVINYEHYKVKPDYYNKPVCEEHDNTPISVVCEECYELKCCQCIPTLCKIADTHSFVTLGDIREELQTKFEDILTQCRVKVSELCALEKKTWQTVDSLSEKCADMVTQIEDTAEEQISAIRKSAERLKEEVLRYQREILEKIEVYLQGVMDKRESLQEIQHSTDRLLRKSNISEIIDYQVNKNDEIDELDKECLTEPEFCEIEMALHQRDQVREIELDLLPKMPSKLILTKNAAINTSGNDDSSCRSVEFLDSSHVLVATGEHMGLYEFPSMEYIEGFKVSGSIQSISYDQKSQRIIFITHTTAYEASKDLSERSCLFSFNYNYDYSPRVAANEHFVVISNAYSWPSKYDIHLYSRKKMDIHHYNLDGVLWMKSLCFNLDGNLLVLNGCNNRLLEYNMKSENKPKLINTISLPEDANSLSICVDISGVVYVFSSRCSLLVLYNGNVLKSVSSSALPYISASISNIQYTDVSVHRDKMIVTYNESNKLCILAMT